MVYRAGCPLVDIPDCSHRLPLSGLLTTACLEHSRHTLPTCLGTESETKSCQAHSPTAIMALLTQLAHSASALLPLVLPSIAAIIAFALFQHFFAPNPLANLPIVGEQYGSYEKKRQAYLTKAKELYGEGYSKVCLVRQQEGIRKKKGRSMGREERHMLTLWQTVQAWHLPHRPPQLEQCYCHFAELFERAEEVAG